MKSMIQKTGFAAALMAAVVFLPGCETDGPPLRAVQITRQDQLIGGPSAKGKLGDFLIENNRMRAIVGNIGPGWAGGIFGGTLLDVDRHRWRSENRDGNGWDSFAESFPLANLLVVNPAQPKNILKFEKDGFKIENTVSAVRILKDGSDGEAVIRVEGHSAYMFDVLKFLNRDFLLSFLKDLTFDFGGTQLDYDAILDLVDGLIGVNILSLLDRLQITFNFTTDFVLHQDESFLTMRTTVELAPPSQGDLSRCKPVKCDLDCPNGYALQEISEHVDGRSADDKYMCPVCQCGESVDSMPTFNESRDFFKVLLGDLDKWKDPTWKGGIVAGDFLFYGSECGIFSPGLGFDYDRKIFENMWQGLGTMGSPLVYDWVAGVANNVSYAWTSVNPNQRSGLDCDEYRWAITRVDPKREDEVVQNLVDNLGWAEGNAKAAGRQAVVDRKAIPLMSFPMDAKDPGPDATAELRKAVFDAWIEEKLAGSDADALRTQLGSGAELGIIPKHQCMPSKMLIPLFSTSATAVLTHFSENDHFTKEDDGSLVDKKRSYTFERYLVVGDGDVGSLLPTIYELRGTPHGYLEGNVYEDGSMNPISHADVFVLRDPRKDDGEPLPQTFKEYQDMAMDAFGIYGPVDFMQSDRGLDKVPDGDYSGPIEPGRYLLLAYTLERGASNIVPVTVKENETIRVNFVLPRWGEVEFRVQDAGGLAMPARLSFIPLDSFGFRYQWEGENEPPLGDPRYDHGILKLLHTVTGTGTVRLPPGKYDVVVSRGLEYGVDEIKGFEVESGQRKTLQAVVPREVETNGYIAGDFHVHARNSVDSGLPMDLRIKAAATEGLEFVSSSDHDHMTDYTPYIKELGLERYLSSQVGVETSPLEYGHFNGYPEVYDDTKKAVHDPPQWVGLTLAQAWEQIKKRMLGGEDSFVLQVNHGRDGFQGYFSQLGMKSYNLERKTPGMEMCDATMAEAPCNFDAMEILNGKHAEYVNTPTVWEANSYQNCYEEIVAARDVSRFPLKGDPADVVCGWLQTDPDPDACEKAVKPAGGPILDDNDTA
ncbi:MAG: hypothetical protein GXP54_13980, partial [Deltaproteobacteria bacterium]|nr:hypothetical protein [Deltaproteobacteria bacterium]